MSGSDFHVRLMRPDDWADYRDLRLEMLADTPTAYVERLADAQGVSDREWQERARRYTGGTSRNSVAIAADGRWIGTMSHFVDETLDPPRGRPWLVAVYVAPAVRGRRAGVADALLDAAEEGVREQGFDRLWLDVHEDNLAAQAFYRRRGYAFTGGTSPYPLDPTRRELEMVRDLDA